MGNEWLEDQKYITEWRAFMRRSPSLALSTKAIGDHYADYFNRDRKNGRYGTAWVGYEKIAEEMGTSTDTVGRHIRKLKEVGFLEEIKRTHFNGTKINRFTIPDSAYLAGIQDTGAGGEEVVDADITNIQDTDLGYIQDTSLGYIQDRNLGNMPSYLMKSPPEGDLVNPPIGAHLTDERPRSIHSFLDEEPERREEFVNYLIAINVPYSYRHALDTFTEAMTDENRTDWAGTFKAYLAGLIDHDGGLNPDNGDTLGMAVYMTEQTELESEDGFYHLDIARAWQGHRDGVSEDEFRRAWEHGLMDHNGTRLMSVASSELVANKYPRELLTVIDSLSRAELSKLAAKFRVQNL